MRHALYFYSLCKTIMCTVQVSWKLAVTEDDGATTLQSLTTLPGYADQANLNGFGARPILFLPSPLLRFGQSYRFRLTALTVCNQDTPQLDPYAEISFTVNTPPVVLDMVVTPSTGFAAATLFNLAAGRFSDADGDLPLQFAFEYAYAGNELAPQDRVTTSLSNFSPNPELNTILQVCRLMILLHFLSSTYTYIHTYMHHSKSTNPIHVYTPTTHTHRFHRKRAGDE
jgi:hypothetical protein